MKKNKFSKYSLRFLIPLFFLVVVFSCKKDRENPTLVPAGVGTVTMNIKGFEYPDPKFSNENKKLASTASLKGTINNRNEANETEIAWVPLKSDYYLIATQSDEAEQPEALKLKGSASNTQQKKAATNLSVGSGAAIPGIKYRIVVLDSKGTYIDQKVYTSGSDLPEDGKALQLNSGSYNFVAYSYNTAEVPAAFNPENPINDISGNKDLLYFNKQVTIVGGKTNPLDITWKHLYTKLTVEIISEEGNISKISASLTPHHVSNKVNLITGALTYDDVVVNFPITNFTGLNTTSITASNIIATPSNLDSVKLIIGSLTAGNVQQMNKEIKFAIKPGRDSKIQMRITKIRPVNSVIQIASGAFHTLALTSTGNVFGVGKKTYGELGGIPSYDSWYSNSILGILRPADYLDWTFKRVPELSDIKKVAVGRSSSYALASDGSLYVAGFNNAGQLGLGYQQDAGPKTFTKVNFLGGKIADIIAAESSAYILTEDGQVFATGLNSNGNLGVGDLINRSNFVKVNSLDSHRVVELVAGDRHALARTNDGKIFGTGQDDKGQLGGIGQQTTFVELKSIPTNVIQMSAGAFNSFLLTDDGSLYSCGLNEDGQLGQGNLQNQKQGFLKTTTVSEIAQVRAFAKHTFLVTKSGRLFATGFNGKGQLGTGDGSSFNKFTRIATLDGFTIKSIVEGPNANLTFTISKDGNVFGTGENYWGTLGIGSVSDIRTFRALPLKLR